MDIVMTFIDQKFDHFIEEVIQTRKELFELNDSTEGRLFPLIFNKCIDFWDDLNELKNKIQDMNCCQCQRVNHVPSGLTHYNCMFCTRYNSV